MPATRRARGPVLSGCSAPRPRQRGQALVYGMFVLVGGLAMLFFLFNTGQLTREKTQLVTTADAVAYSAGVMNARALNHTAYTNRALIANEVAIAQMVSLASWARYVDTHADSTAQLGCQSQYSEPVAKGLLEYVPVCYALYYANAYGIVEPMVQAVEQVTRAMALTTELAKQALQASQLAMHAALPGERQRLMNEVAQANYAGDGAVEVDETPLADGWVDAGGEPFLRRYSGDQRERFRQATLTATGLDPFLPSRRWRSEASAPTCVDTSGPHHDYVRRAGGTTLIGYDEWRALDTVSIWRYQLRGRTVPRCRVREGELGYGAQAAGDGGDNQDAPDARANPRATQQASSEEWSYSGLPGFYELSPTARAQSSGPNGAGPTLDFAVRVLRPAGQTRTSDARAQVPHSPRLNRYTGQPARQVYAGVSAAQAYFDRPSARADGLVELASLFNPYWQVRLIDAEPYLAQARARQGVVAP